MDGYSRLEGRLAALERKLNSSAGLGQGVSTANGAINVRTTQLGFAAELTSDYDATTGYSWKLLTLQTTDPPGLVDPTIQMTGDKAFEINNDEELESGTRVWMEPDQSSTGYVFQVSSSSDEPPPPAPCGGCGWLAGATEYDCFTLSVVGAGGNMASLDLDQTLSFAWVEFEDDAYPDGGYWQSSGDFTICEFTGGVRLWRNAEGEPQLELLDPAYIMSLSCCDAASQTLYFSGGNSGMTVLCCERETNEGPAYNLFTLAVTWSRCPNAGYTTPGWYCVAQTSCSGGRQCCYFEADPGAGILLCSGPHATQETCEALCTPPTDGGDTICCGPLPGVLYVSLIGEGTATLTWDGVSQWLGSLPMSCAPFSLNLRFNLDCTLEFSCDDDHWHTATVAGDPTCSPFTANMVVGAFATRLGCEAYTGCGPFSAVVFE